MCWHCFPNPFVRLQGPGIERQWPQNANKGIKINTGKTYWNQASVWVCQLKTDWFSSQRRLLCPFFPPKVIKNESQLQASGNQIRQQPQEKLPILSLHLNVFIRSLSDLLTEVSKHDWHAHDYPLPLSERFAVRQTHCGEAVDTGKTKARDREQLYW